MWPIVFPNLANGRIPQNVKTVKSKFKCEKSTKNKYKCNAVLKESMEKKKNVHDVGYVTSKYLLTCFTHTHLSTFQ